MSDKTKRSYAVLHSWRPSSMPHDARQNGDEIWLNEHAALGFRLIRAESVGEVLVYVMERVTGGGRREGER